MADKFNGSPWCFLRDFLDAEIAARKAAGFPEQHEYVQSACDAHEALLALWDDSDTAIARVEAADRLAKAARAMTEQMRLKPNAQHTLGAFILGGAIREVDEALAACDVAANRRACTPCQHAT